MHELFEAIFGTCPHGLPGYHWLLDMWYIVLGLPIVLSAKSYCTCIYCRIKEWINEQRK